MNNFPTSQSTPIVSESEWMTLGDAAQFLGVAQSTIRKWADSGRVETFKTPGGHRRFRRTDLEQFVTGVSEQALPISRYGDGAPLVLVIDDDSSVRTMLRISLERDGFQVMEGSTALEGIARINERIPDLLMLDVTMPGIDGWEMLRRVREKLDVTELPVVIFSGVVADDELGSATDRGAQGYLRKPFDPLKLVAQAKALITAG